MGGGDLNLKKSWHPSTMKNVEKVWKAQQQDIQEKKKIAELRRDIEQERDREDLKKYAMEQGAIEKKDNNKLDWMYTNSQNTINREAYLLGKEIDQNFEKFAAAEKIKERAQSSSSFVDHECVPTSLRNFVGSDQVDLTRKLQEDPLYAIKKKEIESRTKLLQNPVKLQKLKELVTKKSSSSSSSSQRRSLPSHRDSDRSREDKDRRHSKKKSALSEKEKLKRLKEMMDNGSWREQERKNNIKRRKEQEKSEAPEQSYNPDFIRKQLAKVVEGETLSSRIKSNINNIQRSNRAMDSNFAKRK